MDEPEDEEELLSEEGLALLLVSASEASADEDVEVGAASGFEADDFWEVCAGVEEGCGEEGVSALELGGGDEEEDGGRRRGRGRRWGRRYRRRRNGGTRGDRGH